MPQIVDLTPRQVPRRLLTRHVLPFVSAVEALRPVDQKLVDESKLEELRIASLGGLSRLQQRDRILCACAINVLCDLTKQGWSLSTQSAEILGAEPPQEISGDIRQRRREQLAARRNEQLREPASRAFIRTMESGHLHRGTRVSVFSLMRDGRDLEAAVRAQGAKAVAPYLQFVTKDSTCELTGFRLQDIWRYFRHTWTNPYESIPGRTMLLLVRDAAAPFHPVMGIAALSSAASVLPTRDDIHLRWTGETVVHDWTTAPTAKRAQWVLTFLDGSLRSIYRGDFIEDDLIPARLPLHLDKAVLDDLRKEGEKAKEIHHRQMSGGDYKDEVPENLDDDNEFWTERARKPLFRAKRALRLATLLELRSVVLRCYGKRKGVERLKALLSDAEGRDAFRKIVRLARAEAIGSAIADLTVCGAVAPYNELLAGKLVAALAVSPETVAEYKRRYSDAATIIGSSMAGRRLVRRADLVFVGTTSLYGVRPSQYDRISIPSGGAEAATIQYKYLGNTKGFGTFQFGSATRESLESLVISDANGRRVNNVFGEGANPKLRALRQGLATLGMPENLLVHGLKKCVYGVDLISNMRDYLLGIDAEPHYLFKRRKPRDSSAAISEWWWQRWASPRAQRPDWTERVTKHRLIYPITHGARVVAPDSDAPQIDLHFSAS